VQQQKWSINMQALVTAAQQKVDTYLKLTQAKNLWTHEKAFHAALQKHALTEQLMPAGDETFEYSDIVRGALTAHIAYVLNFEGNMYETPVLVECIVYSDAHGNMYANKEDEDKLM
jgi:hypothetical protein